MNTWSLSRSKNQIEIYIFWSLNFFDIALLIEGLTLLNSGRCFRRIAEVRIATSSKSTKKSRVVTLKDSTTRLKITFSALKCCQCHLTNSELNFSIFELNFTIFVLRSNNNILRYWNVNWSLLWKIKE